MLSEISTKNKNTDDRQRNDTICTDSQRIAFQSNCKGINISFRCQKCME